MGGPSRYFAILALGCLLTSFLWIALKGYIDAHIQIERITWDMSETEAPWQLAFPLTLLGIFVNEVAFWGFPHLFSTFGIRSPLVLFIFPTVQLVGCLISWFTGRLQHFNAIPVVGNLGSAMMVTLNSIGQRPASGILKLIVMADTKGEGNPHRYKRLRKKNSIRILTLEPSELFNDPIRCKLFEASLEKAPPYSALSYAWDATEGTEPIICHGAVINVTPNCGRALRRIRQVHSGSEINLWVDAICIEQEDSKAARKEKTRQLQLMGQVYKSATGVIAWIGENPHNRHDNVCDFLNFVGELVTQAPDDEDAWQSALAYTQRKATQWVKFRKQLKHFFEESWFTRMWPVQEVTMPLPGRVSLLCGKKTIPWEYIRIGWRLLAELDLLAGEANVDQAVALQFYLSDALALKRNLPSTKTIKPFSRLLISELSELSLSSIMRATRFKACKLAKDKFFALYSILEELEIQHCVDISRYAQLTDRDVFIAVFQSCVEEENGLETLRLAQSADEYIGPLDLWSQRREPADSLENAFHGAFTPIAPILFQGKTGNAPRWRAQLPTWAPDWTQWTHGDIDDRDIAFIRTFSARTVKSRFPLKGVVVETAMETRQSNRRYIWPQAAEKDASDTTCWIIDDSRILVPAKIVGRINFVATVDSIALVWQCVTAGLNFTRWRLGIL